ncbi:hypothetical protein JTB14_018599 [Gonioctena quinquepunctata]|nr:hypothetical protein JTB14_018599 [Gonioctena quinquepunctata]
MRREVFVSNKSHVYCCEDHFKVEEDIESYMFIRTMNSGKVRLKPGVVPRFFDCQKNRITTHSSKPRSQFLQTKAQQSVIETLLLSSKNGTSEENQEEEENEMDIRRMEPISKEIGVQAHIKAYVRSKAIQCGGEGFSTPKITKRKKSTGNEMVPKTSRMEKVEKPINEDISISSCGSTFTFTSSELSLSDPNNSFYLDTNRSKEIQRRTFYLIEKNQKLYLGVPSQSLFVVNLLTKKCELDKLDIFSTLKKIKLNLPYRISADDFSVPLSRVCSIIQKTIPLCLPLPICAMDAPI